MKQKYNIVNVDCANCAAKMESLIKEIDGVADARLNFFAQKLTIDFGEANPEDILVQANKCVKKIDCDAYIEF